MEDWLNRTYPFNFYKGCLSQILLGLLLNTLSHMQYAIHSKLPNDSDSLENRFVWAQTTVIHVHQQYFHLQCIYCIYGMLH